MAGVRTLFMILALAIGLGVQASPVRAAGTDVLSPMDARAYRETFAATARGDFKAADESLACRLPAAHASHSPPGRVRRTGRLA